ncbi:MAG: hypothetical protein LBP53_01580 [Candidatus Peribacteria bacterium]|jgi:hypothetical protein|nr:hypothetical protein [Candidatus Peribacteria bacterium]
MKINIIGIILLFGYSLFKTIKYFSATLTKNNASYQGLTVNYSQSSDTTFLNEQMLTQLQALKPLKITKVAYTGNCLYLYQAINEQPKTASDFLSALVVKEKALTEAEKAELTQKTLSYLQQPAFLSLLTVNYA